MSAPWQNEDEEAEEEDEDFYGSYDDHVIFLIDTRKDMMHKNSKGEVMIINILKLLLHFLKTTIVSSDKQCVGAICFGTVS